MPSVSDYQIALRASIRSSSSGILSRASPVGHIEHFARPRFGNIQLDIAFCLGNQKLPIWLRHHPRYLLQDGLHHDKQK